MAGKMMIGLLGVAAAGAITFAPNDAAAQYGPRRHTVTWQDGDPIPRGYRPVHRMRTGLVVAGAVTFGVTYLTTALVGAAVNDISVAYGGTGRSAKLLIIPLVGPWTLLGSTISAVGQFGLVLDGLVQAAGVGMFIAGLTYPQVVLVPAGYSKNDTDGEGKPQPKLTISPVPMNFGTAGGGFGFQGKF